MNFFKHTYNYYIVFTFEIDGFTKTAASYCELNYKLDTKDALKSIIEYLNKKMGVNNVILMNIVPLKKWLYG